MKRVKLFEAFTKSQGEEISKDQFKNIVKGSNVTYMGDDFEVAESDDTILILKHIKSGKKIHVNYNMFNKKGAISSK